MSNSKEESGAVQGGMDVVLHPLVVISVSDQYTRERLSTPPKGGHTRILGVLLGIPGRGSVEITNSFDIVAEFDSTTGKLVKIDDSFLVRRQKAYETVFPNTKVVGWYQSGDAVDPDDALIIARALSRYSETLIVMMLDSETAFKETTTDIPITFFETELKVDSPEGTSMVFKRCPYHLITIEAERIGVDHIAKSSHTEGKSQLSVQVLGMQGAMKMLLAQIQCICEYLKMVQAGKAPFDHSIMRKIGILRDLIPAAQSPDFEKRYYVEYNDVTLLTYLSSLTTGLQRMNTMADAHVASRPRQERMADIDPSEMLRKGF